MRETPKGNGRDARTPVAPDTVRARGRLDRPCRPRPRAAQGERMPTRGRRWRRGAVATAGTATVLALTSCAVLSTSIREDDTPDGVSTDITDEPVTLTLAYTDDP